MVSYIDCRAKPYHAAIAAHFINSMSDSEHQKDEVIVNFANTSVYWNNTGYADLKGTFEEVTEQDTQFLVSRGAQFFDAGGHLKFGEDEYNPLRVRIANPDPALLGKRIAVLIPIYGSPRFTKQIVRNLKRIEPELRALGAEVFFGVDGHAGDEAVLHRQIIDDAGIPNSSVQCHSRNLGFIGNSNFLFAEAAHADFVVLWTSDVEVQLTALSRCLRPLATDARIALATPWAVGGHNLQAPFADLQDWQGIDSFLSHTEPSYPDAETTVGYFMAIDRSKYRHEALFDLAFDNGYGDDSDLHYRVANLGFRGVLVDNVCVFHDDGGSFSLLDERADLQSKNLTTFRERWDEVYRGRSTTAAENIGEMRLRLESACSFASLSQFSDPRLVFVLPTNDRRIGGVAAVFNMCEAMRRDGVPCSILCTSRPASEEGYRLKSVAYQDDLYLNSVLRNAEMIVATSYDTASLVKSLSRSHGTRCAYFVQGPEYSFNGGTPLGEVMMTYEGFDVIWAVSPFLRNTLERWLGREVLCVPYGPAEFHYVDKGTAREERSIALQFNGRLEKGADYAAAVIAELVRHGYTFYAFGDEAARGQSVNLTRQMGFLTYSEKLSLFNRVEFVMDTSHFEGLGLILMEGIRSGARPLFRLTGGTAALLDEAGSGLRLPDYGAIHQLPEQLEAYRGADDATSDLRRCQAAISGHSVEAAVSAIMECLDA